jgi:tripartite-type tricarboxylate transporter receptor subunit TctC
MRREFMDANRRMVAASLALGALPIEIRAQSPWPSRPIRVISPGSPGGSADLFMRLFEDYLTKALGQHFYIDNRPGATGMLAAGLAANAPPDGYTFFIGQLSTCGIAVSVYPKPSYDYKRQLPPVARFATAPNVIVVKGDSPINTFADLISYVKANPKTSSYSSGGIGNYQHLTSYILTKRLGLEAVHVPHKGDAMSITAVLTGEVTFTTATLPLFVSLAKAGKVKLLAMTQPKRVPAYPDVPTVQEIANIGSFDFYSWYGLFTSTGTPQAIIDRMAGAVIAAAATPELAGRIRDLCAEPAPLGPAAYKSFIEDEIRKWAVVVKDAGVTV